MPALIAEQLPDDAPSAYADSVLSTQAYGAVPIPAFSPLVQACKANTGDSDQMRQCEAIARLLVDQPESSLTQAIGGKLHFFDTGDSTWRDAAHAEQRRIADALSRANEATIMVTDCKSTRKLRERIERYAQFGELQVRREMASASAPR